MPRVSQPNDETNATMNPGMQLGPYRIEALLGRGGMGDVWMARDLRLNRTVAIKTSRSEFNDRFQREARAVAALNHPHIAALFDVGAGPSGFGYLVLEYIEGETLADIIARGALADDQVLRISLQLAEAIEAAHDKGIIHRDLKPANIKLTSDGSVKVLDFGLAKTFGAETEPAISETITSDRTQAGAILGTPAYMSPEQASGLAVDRRSDIWSFGIVLHEMLTGKRMFTSRSVPETLAAVIQGGVKLEDLPPRWRPLIERCLTKDPRRRLQSIGEARIALENGLDSAATGRETRSLIWPIIAGSLALAVLGMSLWIFLRDPAQDLKGPTRWNVDLGSEAIYGAYSTVAVSPDGRLIVFPVQIAGKQMLATRLLSEARINVLAKTENGRVPFFSPKGDWIGFFADRKLRKIPTQGGAVVDLCAAVNARGASWSPDGTIVAALNYAGGLSRIPENGGSPETITSLLDDQTHRWPQVVPESDDIVFTAANAGSVRQRVMIRSARTGTAKVLVEDAYFGRVLPNATLVYVQGGALWGVPFDIDRGEISGTPSKLLEDIVTEPTQLAGQFDFSTTGLFVFRSGRPGSTEFPVKWLDKTGATADLISRLDPYIFPKFSPDGTRLLLNGGPGGPAIYEISSGALLSRIANAAAAMWMPDSKHLLVRRATDTGHVVVFTEDDGKGHEQVLYETRVPLTLSTVSRDGTWVLYSIQGGIWGQQLDLTDPDHPKPGKAQALLDSPDANESPGSLSRDGHWIAYTSDETNGIPEVWVRSFPDLRHKVRITTGFSIQGNLVFSRIRNELFFVDSKGYIFVVEYSIRADEFVSEKPRMWSPTPIRTLGGGGNMDLHPSRDRFAVFPPDPASKESGVHMTFVLNFPELWKR